MVDFESQSEGFAGCLGGDAGWCAGGDGVEEVFEFQAQGFGAREFRLVEGEAGGGMGLGGGGSQGRIYVGGSTLVGSTLMVRSSWRA